MKRTLPVSFSLILIVLALLLPSQWLAETLAGSLTSRLPSLIKGTWILRGSLVGLAGLFLVWGLRPGLFPPLTMPSSLTNLQPPHTQPTPPRLIVLVISGLLLRLIALGSDLWIDEIATLTRFAEFPLHETLTRFFGANQHLLYTTLANLSVRLFGSSEWAVRLPAVLFGVLGIVALYYFARLLIPENEALWATALLTVSYHHIWFSQNARGWIGLVFFTLVTSTLFLHGLSTNRTRTWLWYAVAVALGILLHLNMLFVFMGQFTAYVLVLPRWGKAHWPLTRRLIWVGALASVLTIALYSFVLPEMADYYVNTFYDGANIGWTNPLTFLSVVAQGAGAGFLGLGLLLVGGVFLAGLASFMRQSWLLVGMLVFPAGYTLLAIISLSSGAYPRQFIYILPIAFILVVRGATVSTDWLGTNTPPKLKQAGLWLRQNGATALLSLVVVASLLSLIPYYRTPKQSYRATLAYIESQKQPEDIIVAVGLASSSYRALYGPDLLFPETRDELIALEGETHTTWVIYTFQRDMRIRFGDLYDYLEDNYTLDTTFPGTVGDGTLWVRRTE